MKVRGLTAAAAVVPSLIVASATSTVDLALCDEKNNGGESEYSSRGGDAVPLP